MYFQVSEKSAKGGRNLWLADLQSKLTAILRAELNQDNRCGDRISIE